MDLMSYIEVVDTLLSPMLYIVGKFRSSFK